MPYSSSHRIGFAAAAIASLAAGPARAQTVPASGGWYIAAAGTLTATSDPQTVIFNAPVAPATLTIRDNLRLPGYGGLIAIGHRFGSLRIEAEAGHTYDRAKTYTATAPITLTLAQTGGFAVTRFMANAYFDIPVGGGGVTPYLGGGIGYATYREKTFAARAFAPAAPAVQLIDDRLNHFAWQAIAGVAVPTGTRVHVFAQARYLGLGTARGQDTRGEPITTRTRGMNFDAGVRLSF